MDETEGFFTLKGYALHTQDEHCSSAMEDYLEMIVRLSAEQPRVRVSELAGRLHVRASSVSKMVRQLSQAGYLRAERYGSIMLTGKGRTLGEYLMYRHAVLHRFLCLLNRTDNELEQVEKIEHFLDERTIRNLERLSARLAADAESSGEAPRAAAAPPPPP